jgi:hypothetical protein
VLTVLTLLTMTQVPLESPRSARLLAQAEAPLEAPMAAPLATQIEQLNVRIRAVNVNWPTGAVVVSYAGGALLYIAGVTLLTLLPLGMLAGAPLLVFAGLAIAAAGMLIGGLIVGSNTAAAARAERDELMRERDRLKRELETTTPPSIPGVERWPTLAPQVLLARF